LGLMKGYISLYYNERPIDKIMALMRIMRNANPVYNYEVSYLSRDCRDINENRKILNNQWNRRSLWY